MQTLKRYRFTILLAILIVKILIAPITLELSSPGHRHLGAGVAIVVMGILLLMAAFAVTRTRGPRSIAVVLVVASIVLSAFALTHPSRAIAASNAALAAVLLFLLVGFLVRYVLTKPRVSLDLISAALCSYLLVGVAWTSIYGLIEIARPGSFILPNDGMAEFFTLGSDPDGVTRRLYFSFVTLFTLGYGDVVPMGSLARLSAAMEAFVGQVFLVVLIARLVGVQVAQQPVDPSQGEETGAG